MHEITPCPRVVRGDNRASLPISSESTETFYRRTSAPCPDGKVSVVAECGGGPNGAAIDPDGRVYVCNNGGFEWMQQGPLRRPAEHLAADYVCGSIQAVHIDTGKVETIYAECNGEQLKGPNDIVFDAEGGFCFTDFGKRRGRTIDRGSE